MNLKNIMAVSGLPGLYYLKANRSNGLIIEDISSGKSRFASGRKHRFTPLESLGVYTQTDTVDIAVVFQKMMDTKDSLAVPPDGASDDEIKSYFSNIVENYDTNKVHTKDIRKIMKWFRFLDEKNLLDSDEEE